MAGSDPSNSPSIRDGIGIEWVEDLPTRVPVCLVDFDSFDSFDALCRERLAEGKSVEPLIQHRLRVERDEGGVASIRALLDVLSTKKNPLAALMSLYLAAGITAKTSAQIARELGTSKQNIQQQAMWWKRHLCLRKTRTERSEEGRQKMALRNYKPGDQI